MNCQYGSAEAGPAGIFENMPLSVVDMHGDLWVVSILSPGGLERFATVLDARIPVRAIYARLTPISPLGRHSTLHSGQILTTGTRFPIRAGASRQDQEGFLKICSDRNLTGTLVFIFPKYEYLTHNIN